MKRADQGAFAATLLALALLAGCGAMRGIPTSDGPALVDPDATPATRALFLNLKRLAPEHVLFGHQDDLAYGVHWFGEPGRSDVRETAGSYPAVYGWEIGDLEYGAVANLDSVRFDRMREWIREGYRRGGVITLAWHMDNPVSGGNSWDTTRAVQAILPGGAEHEKYTRWLDRFADFALSLRGDRGELIPVVFRPFHEMTGSWFWWGGRNTTPEEYRQLWRFAVEYLRDRKQVHNLLWAYSTDAFDSREQYLQHYPGDEYVDVLGFDDYQSVRSPETREVLVRRLRDLVELAEARGKIPALTETGVETVPDLNWWTETLLAALKSDPIAQRIAWVLVWRNANEERDRPNHFYGPHPRHPSAPDFVRLREDPLILFEDDLPDLYRLPQGQ